MIPNWRPCLPRRRATTPAGAMSSMLWRTAGFLPQTSGVWWPSSMRSLISAGWRRPSSTLRTASTDLGTSCPKVEQGKQAALHHPKPVIVQVLYVAVGRRRKRNTRVALHLVDDPALFGDVLGVVLFIMLLNGVKSSSPSSLSTPSETATSRTSWSGKNSSVSLPTSM